MRKNNIRNYNDPILGTDDDEGVYDYLIETLPENIDRWELTKDKCQCDECHKYRHISRYMVYHFYCWDGWDYNSNRECWICYIKSRVHSVRYKIKKKLYQIKQKPYQIKQKLKMYKEMATLCPKSNLITFLKTFYKIIKILNKR